MNIFIFKREVNTRLEIISDVVSERHVAEKFRYGIGKNRCGIGISDVVSEFFRYVPFPIPHRKLFLTVYFHLDILIFFYFTCYKITNYTGFGGPPFLTEEIFCATIDHPLSIASCRSDDIASMARQPLELST
jgi:hypothetical protein